MDRNDFSSGDATPSGAGSRNLSSTQGYGAGTTADVGQAYPNSATDASHGLADRARDVAGTAQDKLADVGSTVRDRTGQMKNSLADALHSGAEKLRQRSNAPTGTTSQLASATDTGSVGVP